MLDTEGGFRIVAEFLSVLWIRKPPFKFLGYLFTEKYDKIYI